MDSIDLTYTIDTVIRDNQLFYSRPGKGFESPAKVPDIEATRSAIMQAYFEELELSPNDKFSFDQLNVVSSQELDASQQEMIQQAEARHHRQKIYQNIVQKMSLQVIESVKSQSDLNSSGPSKDASKVDDDEIGLKSQKLQEESIIALKILSQSNQTQN